MGKWLQARRLSWLGAGVLVGLLAGLGMIIRAPWEPGMTAIEGFYTPNVQYGPWFLANNHRLFQQTGELPLRSNYTVGLRYGATDYVNTFINGAALTLSGETDVARIGWLYQVTPWQGLLLIPLAVFALYGLCARLAGKELQPWPLLICYALATLPNYHIVNWAISGGHLVPIGWFLIYSIFLALLAHSREPEHAWRWMLVLIVALLILQPAYHTAALSITIMAGSIWASQRLAGMRLITSNLLGLSVVVFASFLMYHAVVLFGEYGRLFAGFLSDLYRSDDRERLRYMLTGSSLDLRLQVLNYLAVLVPPAWLTLDVLRGWRSGERDVEGRYVALWLLGLLPMGLMLFAWDGLLGVYARLLQYGTLLAVAASVVLLLRRPRAHLALGFCAALCVAVSSASMLTARISTMTALTTDELAVSRWISATQGCERPIFTDFRVGTTLGYQGCFAVVGPTAGVLSAHNQIDRLADLLYTADPARLAATIDTLATLEGERPQIILLSRRFLDAQVGFIVPDMRLKPMSEGQWATYLDLDGWEVAFEHGSALVLVRTALGDE